MTFKTTLLFILLLQAYSIGSVDSETSQQLVFGGKQVTAAPTGWFGILFRGGGGDGDKLEEPQHNTIHESPSQDDLGTTKKEQQDEQDCPGGICPLPVSKGTNVSSKEKLPNNGQQEEGIPDIRGGAGGDSNVMKAFKKFRLSKGKKGKNDSKDDALPTEEEEPASDTTEATTTLTESTSTEEKPETPETVQTVTETTTAIVPETEASEAAVPTEASTQTAMTADAEEECKDGICPMPAESSTEKTEPAEDDTVAAVAAANTETSTDTTTKDVDVDELADQISAEMKVDRSLVIAALGATATLQTTNPDVWLYEPEAAREMIQQELDTIAKVPEESPEVKQLVSEGYDVFLSRRALAFVEMNMDDARALLQAEKMDEEEEEEQKKESSSSTSADESQKASTAPMKTVSVDSNFDPTKPAPARTSPQPTTKQPATPQIPKAAKKEDVVFEATTAQLQELVIESPVPVLLDVYADWCGPCKVLGPALEEMAVKAGGVFRLVKVNSDNERPVSSALGVTALPTVFGLRDGKIVHFFKGMPPSQDFMKNFMMGLLMPGEKFNPPVTPEQEAEYAELSKSLIKTVGAASFSFADRESLKDRITAQLDGLVKANGGDLLKTEESVSVLRALLSNIVNDPDNMKFRTINLENKVIAAKVTQYPACVSMLKNIGFTNEGDSKMTLYKQKSTINAAPIAAARDALDKWLDKSRYEIAKAARARQDELDRQELDLPEEGDEDEGKDEMETKEAPDPNQCKLKVRLDGKKKVHELTLNADDPIEKVIEGLSPLKGEETDIQITCVSKRLVIKRSETAAMQKTLREYGLLPSAALVLKVLSEDDSANAEDTKLSLSERAAAKKRKKTGTHTMQSIGIYAKDDNNKAELIDGGGGVWYEHDVSDDEDEKAAEESNEEVSETKDDDVQEDADQDDAEETAETE